MDGETCCQQNRMAMREVTREVDEIATERPGLLTSEFWGSIGVVITNLIMVLGVIGWMSPDDSQSITQAITAMIAATQGLLVNGAVIWKYIQSRTAVKSSQLQLRQHLLVERMRLAHSSGVVADS